MEGHSDLDPDDRPGASVSAALDHPGELIVTGMGGVAPYILKLDPHPVQTTFICLVGDRLGVLFLIPLGRYSVRGIHGLLPHPEATAITEVLPRTTFSSPPSRCGKSRSNFSSLR